MPVFGQLPVFSDPFAVLTRRGRLGKPPAEGELAHPVEQTEAARPSANAADEKNAVRRAGRPRPKRRVLPPLQSRAALLFLCRNRTSGNARRPNRLCDAAAETAGDGMGHARHAATKRHGVSGCICSSPLRKRMAREQAGRGGGSVCAAKRNQRPAWPDWKEGKTARERADQTPGRSGERAPLGAKMERGAMESGAGTPRRSCERLSASDGAVCFAVQDRNDAGAPAERFGRLAAEPFEAANALRNQALRCLQGWRSRSRNSAAPACGMPGQGEADARAKDPLFVRKRARAAAGAQQRFMHADSSAFTCALPPPKTAESARFWPQSRLHSKEMCVKILWILDYYR